MIMIPVTLALTMTFVLSFIWATRDGQWNDLDLTPDKLIREPINDERNNETRDRGSV